MSSVHHRGNFVETTTSTLLSLRFVSYPEPREPKIGNRLVRDLPLLELPEWAPPQARAPLADLWAEAPTEHYESWQGICW
jgi:hypothetical protein